MSGSLLAWVPTGDSVQSDRCWSPSLLLAQSGRDIWELWPEHSQSRQFCQSGQPCKTVGAQRGAGQPQGPAELLCMAVVRYDDLKTTVAHLKTVKATERTCNKMDHPSRSLR